MSRPRSSQPPADLELGLSPAQAAAIGSERAAQVRSFRLLLHVARQLRHLADQLYRADGLTTQQATLLTIVRVHGRPSLSEVAAAMHVTHQNVKQLVDALVAKGFVRLVSDARDARVRRLRTTKKNDRYWAARDPLDFEHVRTWFGALSAGETGALFELLSKLERGLRPQIEANPPSRHARPGRRTRSGA